MINPLVLMAGLPEATHVAEIDEPHIVKKWEEINKIRVSDRLTAKYQNDKFGLTKKIHKYARTIVYNGEFGAVVKTHPTIKTEGAVDITEKCMREIL